MNLQHRTASHWSRRFLLLTLVVALLHYCLLTLAGAALINTAGEKLNFFTAVVLPLVAWVLSMPAQVVARSGFINRLDPIGLSVFWMLNSLAWGVLLGAVITWIWRRRDEFVSDEKS